MQRHVPIHNNLLDNSNNENKYIVIIHVNVLVKAIRIQDPTDMSDMHF